MQSLAIIAGVLLFIIILLIVQTLERYRLKRIMNTQSKQTSTYRSVYHLFFVLILWSCLVFGLSGFMDFRAKLFHANTMEEQFIVLLRAIFLPTVFLLLVLYGKRKGYFVWIKESNWPKDE